MPGAGGKYGGGVGVGLNLQCSFLFRKDALKLGFQNPCGMVLGNQGICCTDHGMSVGGGGGGGSASQLPRQVSYTQACSHTARQTVTETDQRNLKKYYCYRMV